MDLWMHETSWADGTILFMWNSIFCYNWIKCCCVYVPCFLFSLMCCLLSFCPGASLSLFLSSDNSWMESLEFSWHQIISSPETVFFQFGFLSIPLIRNLNIWKQVTPEEECETKVTVLSNSPSVFIQLLPFMSFPFYGTHLGVGSPSLCSWFKQKDNSHQRST